MSYYGKLWKSAQETGSIACMGLDPVVEAMPEKFARHGVNGVLDFLGNIFTEMQKQKVFPGAFKSNQGFYIKHDRPLNEDFSGSKALVHVLRLLREEFSDIPVILDNKRGDIGKSSANYAAEGFDCWKADAVTVHPYMGSDSVMPFVDKGGCAYILIRTSNPGAKDFQDIVTGSVREEGVGRELCLYENVAHKIDRWAREKKMEDNLDGRIGAVIGATYPDELSDIVKIFEGVDIPLLIPGVGGQGGSAEEVMSRLKDANYDLALARINSSSGITHPWAKKKKPAPKSYAKVCVGALNKLNEAIDYKYKS